MRISHGICDSPNFADSLGRFGEKPSRNGSPEGGRHGNYSLFSRLCSLYFHWAQLAGRILLEMVRLWTAASLFSQSMDGSPNGRGRFCRTSFRGDHDLLCWSDGLVLRVLCWGSWGGLVMVDDQASVHTRCLACPHVGRSLLDGGWLLAHLFCGTSKLNMSPWA